MSPSGIYLCAEVGVSYDTKPRLFKLIKDCLDNGAHAIKLQLFNEDVLKDYPPELHQRLSPMILGLSDLCEISSYVHANGGELVVTPFYIGAMDMLKKVRPFPVDGYKIRAKDFTNQALAQDIVSKAGEMPVYLSIPHDRNTETPPTSDDVWRLSWSIGVHTVYCRPEYPPKKEEMNLWKSLQYNGISLHSNEWEVHAIACAMHLGHEERRPREHAKRFYCEVHVMPKEQICVVGDKEYAHPLDREVSIFPSELERLRHAIDLMEETIG